MSQTPPSSSGYSPFGAIVAVFLSLTVLQAAYVAGDFNDRAQIDRSRAELAPLLGQAQKITQVVENLGKDLITLADAHNAEAARIVADLNIKLNLPPAAGSPAR